MGFLTKRPEECASEIWHSSSGTCSPNRFSLLDRVARSWFFFFSLDSYENWIFLSSSLVNTNRVWTLDLEKNNNLTVTHSLCAKQTQFFRTSVCPAPLFLWKETDVCSWSLHSALCTYSPALPAAPSQWTRSSVVLCTLSLYHCSRLHYNTVRTFILNALVCLRVRTSLGDLVTLFLSC